MTKVLATLGALFSFCASAFAQSGGVPIYSTGPNWVVGAPTVANNTALRATSTKFSPYVFRASQTTIGDAAGTLFYGSATACGGGDNGTTLISSADGGCWTATTNFSGGVLLPTSGGTGISNPNANTLTLGGANAVANWTFTSHLYTALGSTSALAANGSENLLYNSVSGANVLEILNQNTGGYSAITYRDASGGAGAEHGALGWGNSASGVPQTVSANFWETSDLGGTNPPPYRVLTDTGVINGTYTVGQPRIGFNGTTGVTTFYEYLPNSGTIDTNVAFSFKQAANQMTFPNNGCSTLEIANAFNLATGICSANGNKLDFYGNGVLGEEINGSGLATFPAGLTVSGGALIHSSITADTGHTDASVCEDTTTHQYYSGTGTGGLCLGTSTEKVKVAISEMSEGLWGIMRLHARHWVFKLGHGDNVLPPNAAMLFPDAKDADDLAEYVMANRETFPEWEPHPRWQFGFIAEKMVKVFPGLVGRDKNGDPNTVDLLGLVPVLVKAVQAVEYQVLALWGLVIGLVGCLAMGYRRVKRLETRLAAFVLTFSASPSPRNQ